MKRLPDNVAMGRRVLMAKVFVCVALSLLGVRLWYLQCVHGSYYRDLSENNRRRTIRVAAPRGAVLDREGRVLVRNRPAFHVALMLEDTPDVESTLERLASITGRTLASLKRTFHSRGRSLPFEPKVVMYDVSREELARVKVNSHNLPGVIVNAQPTRAYPHEDLAAQLFGYIREITREQLDARREEGYRPGDMTGQTGIERTFEEYLRGRAGYVQVEVDARGRRRGELGIVDNVQGSDLQLTIDLDLQRAAQDSLAGRKGAVVALDPRNGEVLVLASSPSFDANIFSGQMLRGEWEQVSGNESRPLRNRGISSIYPPGSTIKLLWAVAGLATGVVTPETRLYCPGYYRLGSRRYHCHKRSGHGHVNLLESVKLSCNVYFYQLGQQLAIKGMSKFLEMFGFGQLSGVPLPGESSGTLPSEQWKLERFGERWYPGDTLPVSIGQGYLVVTPIQLATMASVIANGGTVYRPLLVKRVYNPKNGEAQEFDPVVVRKLDIPAEVFKEVRSYAASVVNDARGTGRRAALEGVAVAGKTGTAQVGALGKEKLAEHMRDHAWFVAFAPAEEPTIAMAVLVENAGQGGGAAAAPVARDVLEVFFRKQGMLPEPPPVEEEAPAGVREADLETEQTPSAATAQAPTQITRGRTG